MRYGIIILVLVLLAIGGIWYWQASDNMNGDADGVSGLENTFPAGEDATDSDTDNGGLSVDIDAGASGSTVQAATITYADSGFSPATLRVSDGTTVTFRDQSTRSMWVASAAHPTHTVYAGTTLNEHCPDTVGVAFDQCAVGSTYSFTFTKTGTWNYHNHRAPQHTGTIIVE